MTQIRRQRFQRRLVQALLPLRRVSPRLASQTLAAMGLARRAVSPTVRVRFDRAAQIFAHHLDADWSPDAAARALAANEPRWLARDRMLDGLSDDRFEAMFRVAGRDRLDAALAGGRGVVLLACHYGSNLVPLHWLVRAGYALRIYMERPNSVSRFLERHFDDDEPLGQSRLFISRRFTPAESAASILRAVRVLRCGMVLALAGDVPFSGSNSAPAQFLGRSLRVTTTWVQLAAMSAAPVLPVFCRVAPDGTYDLAFQTPYDVPRDAVSAGRIEPYIQRCLGAIEDQIRIDPSNANEYVMWLDRDAWSAAPA